LKKVKVGIIGAGSIARHAHVPSFTALDDVEVAAICDPKLDRAKALAKEFDIPKTFADYRKLLREGVDAVIVAAPNKLHAPVSIAALESGKHVLCEKPLATSKAEVKRMLDAAGKAKRLLMGAFSFRYQAEVQAMAGFIKSGKVGRPYYAKACYLRRRGTPGFGGWFTNKELAGGGALFDIGVHVLDGALFLMGMPKPVAVSGQTFLKFKNAREFPGGWGYAEKGGTIDVEDAACALVRLEDGGVIVVEASWALNVTEPGIMALSIMGEKGGVSYKPLKGVTRMNGNLVEVTFPEAGKTNAYEAEAKDFINSIRTGKPPLGRAEDALVVAEIMDAIYKSAARGAEVRL